MTVSRLAWVVLVGAALVVAAAAVPVSAMLWNHPAASTPEVNNGHKPWGPSFPVTFTETGLPSGTNWSVTVSFAWQGGPTPKPQVTPDWGRFGTNSSTTSTIGFEVPNGTWAFSVAEVVGSNAVYNASPSQGQLTVNGSSVSESVAFTAVPLFGLTFSESGLPSGTNWSVSLFGGPSDGSGHFEPGAAGPDCYQNVSQGSSDTPSIVFELQNGSYVFSIPNVTVGSTLYEASPGAGNVTLQGGSVTVDVTFTAVALYTVSFVETGLSAGAFWLVQIWGSSGGAANGSNTSTIGFELPDGTYNYQVLGAFNSTPCTPPTPQFGSFTVDGAAVTIDITFTPLVVYTVTFDESGLPAGANWSVGLFGNGTGGGWGGWGWGGSFQFNSSNGTSLTFSVPDGNYSFFVNNVSAGSQLFVPSPSFGNVTVNGAAVTVDVDFAALTLYNVTIVETGLPSGTFWSAFLFNDSLGGAWNGTTNTSLSFLVPNGTYTFGISLAGNCTTVFLPSPASGNVTVDGAAVTIDVTFSPLTFYTITVVESGLPANTTWYASIEVSGVGFGFNVSNNTSLTFYVPNGTYLVAAGPAWSDGTVYLASPSNEVVTVSGSSVTVDVTYTAA